MQTPDDIPSNAAAERPPIRFGLSAKLLVLTVLFVMLAEVCIYVPSIANFLSLTSRARRPACRKATAGN